jgi:uncharacterized membrane protein
LLLAIQLPAVVVVLAGLALLLVFPGYASLAALLPHRPEDSSMLSTGRSEIVPVLSLRERMAVAFGLSLGLSGILGLLIEASIWDFSTLVGGGVLLLSVLLGTLLATIRGHVSPFDRQGRYHRARRFFAGGGGSTIERVVSIVLVLSVLLAFVSLGAALLVPQSGESYTGMALLSGAGEDGAVAADYPATLVRNEPTEFVVLVQNREGSAMEYTLVISEQWMTGDGESATVDRERELSRRSLHVPADHDQRVQLDLMTSDTGSNLRIAFYLYRGTAPGDVSDRSSYRQLYVWVEVVEDSSNH